MSPPEEQGPSGPLPPTTGAESPTPAEPAAAEPAHRGRPPSTRGVLWAVSGAVTAAVAVAATFLVAGAGSSAVQRPGSVTTPLSRTTVTTPPTITTPTITTPTITTPTITTPTTTRSTITTPTPSRPVVTSPVRSTPSSTVFTPPAGLSAAQQALWKRLPMEGVYYDLCVGYPPGEQISGIAVNASLQCPLADSGMDQPITYYQFPSGAALDRYMDLRASGVGTPTGICESGQETNSRWTAGGVDEGRMVCVDNVNNGVALFKIVFAYDADSTAAVVQDADPATVIAWWQEHAVGQFEEN